MLDYGKFLIDRQILRGPHYVNFLLGSLGTLSANPLHLALLVNSLPSNMTWAAAIPPLIFYRHRVIAARAKIGSHVVINRGALIGHHVQIADCTNIGPGANIGGGCRIGEGVYVGIGATLVDHLNIGPVTVVGAGAVVTRDLPSRVLAVGVPAKIIKENIEGK